MTRLPAPRPRATPASGSGKVLRLPLPDSDAALVAALRADPIAAPGLLFDRYGEDVERILYRILGADTELYDVLHEVFLAAQTSLARLREESALRSWLTGIAVHKAKKLIRRRQRWRWIQSVAPFDLPDVMASTPAPEVSEALTHAYRVLDELPADERIAFALRHIDGMDLAGIAATTQVSLATTKRRIARAQLRFVEAASQSDVLREWLERGTLSR
ncbi:MAG TPA: sigma-70 family RNA polymerase sigma factor [Polyangiaceae bacterium]|nr:sigma-70 family RNA polymerase sigma factor [Polyangiaceae bacterium]